MRRSVLSAFAAVPFVGLAACQLVSGLSSLEEGNESTALGDGGGDGGRADSDATDAAADAPSNAPTLGGQVHFLRTGPLVLSAGVSGAARTVTVSTNGPFTFPGSFAPTDTFEVRVESQPTDQQCWVRSGTGTIGAGFAAVEVRCTLVMKSVGNGSDQSTLSTTFVDMADVAPISIVTDQDAKLLTSLSIPIVEAWTNAYAEYRFAIEVDGVVASQSVYRSEKHSPVAQVPAFVSAIVPIGKGSHTVKAKWRYVMAANTQPQAGDALKRRARVPATGTLLAPELDAVVLESTPAFDHVASSSSSTPLVIPTSSTYEDFALIPNVSVAAPGHPTLVLVHAPGIRGADSGVKLTAGGSIVAYQRRVQNDLLTGDTTFAPIALLDGSEPSYVLGTSLSHLAGASAGQGVEVCFGGPCGGVDAGAPGPSEKATLSALVWKVGTTVAAASSPDHTTVGGGENGFVTVKSTSINAPRAGKALVFMNASGVVMEAANEWAEVGVFAGAARTATVLEGHGEYADVIRSNAFTAMGIIDLPAGTTALELRARNAQGNAVTVGTPFPLKAGMLYTSHYAFGAVLLE